MSELEKLRGVVLVMEGDAVAFQYAAGIAERSNGMMCTQDTRFQLASVSKQFTAAAILVLVARGVVSVEDQVDRWIAGCPPAWGAMTIRHLLTHTSGLVHWHDLSEIDLTEHMEAEEELAIFQRAALRSRPGASWYYSSPGYVLLAHIVQRAADRPYAAFLAEEVFRPLGMVSSFAGSATGQERIAHGHTDGLPVRSVELDIVSMGAGDVWSTTGDVARLDAALASGTFLSPTSRRAMLAIQAPIREAGFLGADGYGYGWFVGRMSGRRAFYHTGDNPGFIALNAWFPDDDWRLIVLANEDSIDGELVIKELLLRMFPLLE